MLAILPEGSLPGELIEQLRALLGKEIASIADDWHARRSWFIRGNNPRTNQWVLPTEGLIRACLVLGRENYPREYEMGVRNLTLYPLVSSPHTRFFCVSSLTRNPSDSTGPNRASRAPATANFPARPCRAEWVRLDPRLSKGAM